MTEITTAYAYAYNLTVEDVAAHLKIKRRTLYHRITSRGLFASQKIGRRLYFSHEVFSSPLAMPG